MQCKAKALVFSLLALGIAVAVAACGSSSSNNSSGSGGGGSSSAAAATGASGATSTAAAAASGGAPSWCGSKKITFALADGFGDNNWRKITVGEARDEAAQCKSITKFDYTDGQGNTQKAISDIHGLAAQGVNAAVVFPDAGEAVLPAIRDIYKAGVVTVPYRVSPGGTAGTDYNYYISTQFQQAGALWGKWLDTALHCKGNVINLGGPPANSQSLAEYQGLKQALASCPGIHIIGQTPYYVTNWDPAQTQKVVTAVLAKYPKIDAITTDFGAALASAFSAFSQANRKIPAIATEDSNQLSCDQKKDGFPLFTVDSQNWMVRTAVDFAVAKATGGTVPSSTVVPQKPFEDSLTGKPHPVECVSSLPSDAILSSHLTHAQLKAALGE
ncbi:MAG TPA: substrate-binding domain-containing protein [Solirubrobacteraceae bacterium]|nr:substrate-binding domain-containing protein [Solirubrobacteraceae bacterium]